MCCVLSHIFAKSKRIFYSFYLVCIGPVPNLFKSWLIGLCKWFSWFVIKTKVFTHIIRKDHKIVNESRERNPASSGRKINKFQSCPVIKLCLVSRIPLIWNMFRMKYVEKFCCRIGVVGVEINGLYILHTFTRTFDLTPLHMRGLRIHVYLAVRWKCTV